MTIPFLALLHQLHRQTHRIGGVLEQTSHAARCMLRLARCLPANILWSGSQHTGIGGILLQELNDVMRRGFALHLFFLARAALSREMGAGGSHSNTSEHTDESDEVEVEVHYID